MNYNLLDEEWIPVLYRDGRWERVGIRRAFEDAGRIRQIAASNPMDRVAILRFLLALLYWSQGDPPDTPVGDGFPADYVEKLDDNRDCFNLLGDGKRFYQQHDAQRPRAVTDLIQEIPTGNNFWHFRHSTDQQNGLCPACCAIGLLRLPLFSVSGLPDLKAGINGTPPIYVVPWGMSLLAALRANWLPHESLGMPAWVCPGIETPSGEEVPLLTGLTALSRRVWLHPPEVTGACVACGSEAMPLIRTCQYQSAGDQKNDLWNDPHVIYPDETPRKGLPAPDLTAARKFRMDRPWPRLFARMVETGAFGRGADPTSLLIVGFATDKAKNIDVWERSIDMPPGATVSELASSLVELWDRECFQLGKRMGRPKEANVAVAASVRPHIEHAISARAGELLTADDQAWQDAAAEYQPMMGLVARALSPGFTSRALQRRRAIGAIAPDMRPRHEPEKKSKRKKGGTK
ncbi:MAG TPA: type I-E CRISPR-associated protein Cse1/CasA [Candidatus Hydrogenedentes bacterium]|nr:type I-E CRISPR-associated protein Cse1/CasA [Candidatus Hydrogenedentota bacterium]HPG65201.1 type I-E CRISPR-associated protein Cse1/CasA [Candidatus Hydrogenedentota bacterium]